MSAPTAETNWGARKLFEALTRHRPLVVPLDDLRALLERALRARLVDEQTGRRALQAAEGNPLLLEQCSRSRPSTASG